MTKCTLTPLRKYASARVQLFAETLRTFLVSHSIEPGLITKTGISLLECGVIKSNQGNQGYCSNQKNVI